MRWTSKRCLVFQSEMQSEQCIEKSAMCCITYFPYSFNHGMLLVSQPAFSSCWPALVMVGSISFWQGAWARPALPLPQHMRGFMPAPGRKEQAVSFQLSDNFCPCS